MAAIRSLIGKVNLVFFTTILFSTPALSQSTLVPGSSLEDFFTAAINYSTELRIAEENLNIGSARKRAASGQLLPQINAGASVSDNRVNQMDQFRQFDGERYYLSLTQVLFNWQVFSERKRASFLEDQLEEQYYYQLATILTDVAGRYFNVLQASDALDSIDSEINALTNQLEQIQSLFDRQLAQLTDVYQGQASLAAAQAEQLKLEAEQALTRESLRSVSGLEVGPLYRLSDSSSVPELEYTQQYYVDQAQEKNHLILASKSALKAAQERVSGQKGAYAPTVSFIAQRQDSDVGFDNLPIARTDNTYVGLNLSIPIYRGGTNRAAVSEALSIQNIAEYEVRASELETRERVRAAYLLLEASRTQIDAAQILVESTALASEAMQQGFTLGTVTSVDVLNALRDQFRAERDLQRTRYDQIEYFLLLKRETGALTAEDMIEVGEWLEPGTL
jgi:outer membrane protein